MLERETASGTDDPLHAAIGASVPGGRTHHREAPFRSALMELGEALPIRSTRMSDTAGIDHLAKPPASIYIPAGF